MSRFEARDTVPVRGHSAAAEPAIPSGEFVCLKALERKVLWLSTWMIHHANHLRPNRDGLKVGGHQASSASLVTLMTALYFAVLRPEDRVAVKPHASPVFHTIQYLLGRENLVDLQNFRAFGGAQSYPSRTKDKDDVDFSTGSVGLGVAETLFAALTQDYLAAKALLPEGQPLGRMVALLGDAELDEGNVFEAMLEGWKHKVRNLWWIVDYNRQSLDAVVPDRLFGRFEDIFATTGFRVQTLKYGRLLQAAFLKRGGDALRRWIDDCPNSAYSALTFKGGRAWREQLGHDLGDVSGIRALLDDYDDESLQALMTNLAGHDIETVLDAFLAVKDDAPRCFIAYTVKGHGLSFAGHKDNHAGLMTPAQMTEFRAALGVPEGQEWEPFSGLAVPEPKLRDFLAKVPFAAPARRRFTPAPVVLPERLPVPQRSELSTQEGFGWIMNELGRSRSALSDRIVTASPDVTVSTNLGGWVNQRGVFDREAVADIFRELKVVSMLKWEVSPKGQHFELGIAESNLFLLLAALGLSASLFGVRLFPIGTLYDPFITRGLDALNYGCYQDSRFLLVATPSGITLAPEGGAHQSVLTPLIGIGQDRLAAFEPAFVDELAIMLQFAFHHLQAEDGGSVYLRLSTRPLTQPKRELSAPQIADLLAGAYWQIPPRAGAELAIAYSGAVAREALEAHAALADEIPGLGLLAVPSADRLHDDWRHTLRLRREGRLASAHIEGLLEPLARDAGLVTVLDGHPATLSWLGAATGRRVYPLGVDRFGQSGDIADLYAYYGLSVDAIVEAAASACLGRIRG